MDVELLKSFTSYSGYFSNPDEQRKEILKWFWEVLEEMSNEDRRKYWKFVNGSSKLSLNFRDQEEKHKIS